jgi:phenylacetate-CoA ligase
LRIYASQFETADREAIRACQLRKIKALVEKTWSTNEFYRALWSAAGVDVARIDSLEAFSALIPTVEKKDFIADQDDDPPFGRRHAHLLSLGVPYTLCTTGGTSGQGVEVHMQSADEVEAMNDLFRYQLTWAGMKRGEPAFVTLPLTMMAGGRLEYTGIVAFGLSVSLVGNYDAERKLELMRRYRPKALIGTTSYFGHLAAVSDQLPPFEGLECLITGGEGSGHAYLERLERQWGARVFDRYGSSQMANDHMFSCEAGVGEASRPGMLHNIEPMVFFEVVDPETGRHVKDGEAGELILTSLYRTDSPIIRCRMRDRAVYREARYCGCGRPFAGLEIASIGRVDDMKKVKGVNIWPQAVEDAVFAETEVEDFEIILASDAREADTATARVMPRGDIAAEDAARLKERLGETLRSRIGIRFEVDVIAPGALARGDLKVRRWKDVRIHRHTAD